MGKRTPLFPSPGPRLTRLCLFAMRMGGLDARMKLIYKRAVASRMLAL